jgi:hypothetical protein
VIRLDEYHLHPRLAKLQVLAVIATSNAIPAVIIDDVDEAEFEYYKNFEEDWKARNAATYLLQIIRPDNSILLLMSSVT